MEDTSGKCCREGVGIGRRCASLKGGKERGFEIEYKIECLSKECVCDDGYQGFRQSAI